jgi:hypothetical protein
MSTKIKILELTKPLSSYQYYTKHFREQWNTMSEEDKEQYLIKSKQDNQRYEKEKEEIKQAEREVVKKLGIYLRRSYGRVPCVGLDMGFYSEECIGPAEEVEEYGLEEQKLFGIKFKSITISGLTWKHNKQYKIRHYQNAYTAGRAWRKGTKWGLTDSKKQFHTRHCHDCFGKSWQEDKSLSFYAVKK